MKDVFEIYFEQMRANGNLARGRCATESWLAKAAYALGASAFDRRDHRGLLGSKLIQANRLRSENWACSRPKPATPITWDQRLERRLADYWSGGADSVLLSCHRKRLPRKPALEFLLLSKRSPNLISLDALEQGPINTTMISLAPAIALGLAALYLCASPKHPGIYPRRTKFAASLLSRQ